MRSLTLIGLLALVLLPIAEAAPLHGALDALTLRQDYEAKRESSSSPDLTSNGDAVPIPPGERL